MFSLSAHAMTENGWEFVYGLLTSKTMLIVSYPNPRFLAAMRSRVFCVFPLNKKH